MNQESEESRSPTTTSPTRSPTDDATPTSGNVSTADRRPIERKVDDKAAALEDQLVDVKARFNKERFVYLFVITVLVDCLVGYSAPNAVFGMLVVASMILLLGLAQWLEFPWIVEHLGRFVAAIERRLGGDKSDETEP